MGGKSRKTGATSKKLIERLTQAKIQSSSGKGSNKGKPPGIIDRGHRGLFSDFSAEEVAQRRALDSEKDKT